ncbi:MAG: EMC3/TMCO1 family protein [Candidatus Hodarchaeales archaeon]
MDLLSFIASLITTIINLPNTILNTLNFTDPPLSSIFILCVAIGVSLFSITISRRLMDVDKLKRYSEEMKRYNALKMKALRGKDSKAIKKYELESEEASRIQKEMMSMRLKPMMFTMIPLMLVFGLMNGFYGSSGPGPNSNGAVAAVLPFSFIESLIIIPLGWNVYDTAGHFLYFQTSYIGWYFTISITIGSLIQKLAGMSP